MARRRNADLQVKQPVFDFSVPRRRFFACVGSAPIDLLMDVTDGQNRTSSRKRHKKGPDQFCRKPSIMLVFLVLKTQCLIFRVQ